MRSILEKIKEPAYAIMRISFGLLFACHGAQKLFGLLGGTQVSMGLIWIAGLVELVGGLAIAFGLFTNLAALLSSGQMLIAYMMVHQPKAALPIQNNGELALLYAFAFLFILCKGSGIWSLDKQKT